MIAPNGVAAPVPDHVTQTLAWIEDQIAQLWTARSALMRSFGIPEPDQGNGLHPEAGSNPPAPKPSTSRKPSERRGTAMRIRDHLLAAGPGTSSELAVATNLAITTVSKVCKKSPWFEKVGNQFGPWQLTDAGKGASSKEEDRDP